jgi:hypothetical protein
VEEKKGEEKGEKKGIKGRRTPLTPGGYFFERLREESGCKGDRKAS